MSSQELLRKFCKTIQNIYKTLVGSCICTKLTKYRSANMIDWRHQFLPNDIDCFFIKEKKNALFKSDMSQDIDSSFKRSLNCLTAIKSFQQLSDSPKKYPLDKTTFTLEIYHC